MRKLILIACLSFAVHPAAAQTITSTNLPNPLRIDFSDGTSRMWNTECHHIGCNTNLHGLLNLQSAQQQGFLLPPDATPAPSPQPDNDGGSFETGLAIGFGIAAVAGIAAWAIWGRDNTPSYVQRSPGRVALAIPLN